MPYAKLGDWGQGLRAAKGCDASGKIQALSEVLTVRAQQQNPALAKMKEAEEE